MYSLIIKPAATKMAEDAYKWYEDKQKGLGEVFLFELVKCYNKLEIVPASYTTINKNFRQIILKKFPYTVIYEIMGETVVEYSVFHTSRNPQKKFRKT